jgi:phosphoribosylformylglycinamidine synthase
MVYRIYSEKKKEYAVEAGALAADLARTLGADVKSVRIFNRYDVEGVTDEDFGRAKRLIFSEPNVDDVYETLPAAEEGERMFAAEYLPGQFDVRADSCAQCFSLLTGKERPTVRSGKVYAIKGDISDEMFEKIKKYLINPVESREASFEKPLTLETEYDIPTEVETLYGFTTLDRAALEKFVHGYGLAMDVDDIVFLQDYFKNTEERDPTVTEIRMIDTYWSDHCRHTTFSTVIDDAAIDVAYIKDAYNKYLSYREELGTSKPVCLMDIATIGGKLLKKRGILKDLDVSEEINACSVKIKAKVDGVERDTLLMFKNETHNHPTEIEPFGGAATCLGGAIRDPLSGRAYVYQAMRVTGAADPRVPFEKTLKGKLPQRKITTTAAAGYSSYGNQIGLATGIVNEFYHEGYVAKRMEIGAVIGAADAANVVRERPEPGDVIILLGGATGRDGCGGATGSSKQHTLDSITECGAEVQKGNPVEELKIQKMFRRPEVTRLIKRCNDFGAGGVSVAVGELADGLDIDLDKVPKKYEGLDGTELAISESQERMAVVVDKNDAETFIKYAAEENLNAVQIAVVTDTNRLVMHWNGKETVNISRDFLNSNGAEKHTEVKVPEKEERAKEPGFAGFAERMNALVSDLNVCCQKGLVERFDGSIGARSVLWPFGGKDQLTPAQAMAAKIPCLKGESGTASVMAYGFDPYLSSERPFKGAVFAIVESVAKLIAAGCPPERMWLSLQEYFESTKNDPERWGKPFEALLGALTAQVGLGIAAIGGKDSMSGTFEDIDVPPTLVSFAVSTADADKVKSNEFKTENGYIYACLPEYTKSGLPKFAALKENFALMHAVVNCDFCKACSAITSGGIAEAVFKMAAGNGKGVELSSGLDEETLFAPLYGGFIFETDTPMSGFKKVGRVTSAKCISYKGESVFLDSLIRTWKSVLEDVFPLECREAKGTAKKYVCENRTDKAPAVKIARPKVVIPAFPGTNCEYDSARAFETAGAETEILLIRNRTALDISGSVERLERALRTAQILMIPGGFSGGDEPEGSGKFIATFFRNERIKEIVNSRIKTYDFLILGICNGFQALIKLGLLPYGEIRDIDETSPTLTFNSIGRHQSLYVDTRVSSLKSPWMNNCALGDIYSIPVSHGEGRFVASPEMLSLLAKNGQIATQYVDKSGAPSMDIKFNPNTSADAIEGIFSPDGKIFGKMGHCERRGENIAINIPGRKDMKIFEAGVEYFR